jgi:hypothetical protein
MPLVPPQSRQGARARHAGSRGVNPRARGVARPAMGHRGQRRFAPVGDVARSACGYGGGVGLTPIVHVAVAVSPSVGARDLADALHARGRAVNARAHVAASAAVGGVAAGVAAASARAACRASGSACRASGSACRASARLRDACTPTAQRSRCGVSRRVLSPVTTRTSDVSGTRSCGACPARPRHRRGGSG